jgi:Secretion system C-terminal sorting domain
MLKFLIFQDRKNRSMKHTLIIISIAFVSIPCKAQWKGEAWSYVPAYGVHDSTLFASEASYPAVFRYGPDTNWHTADAGMNFSQGPATSFTSIGNYFFASEAGTGPGYRSNDNGASWMEDVGGFMCSNEQYVFGVANGGLGKEGIYRSGDSGSLTSWKQVTTFTATVIAAMGYHIFATTVSNGLWRSSDTGTNWSQVAYPLASPGTFAVLDTLIFAGSSTGQTGIARSTDSGGTWISIGFPHAVTALCTDGRNLWAGTMDSGVYISTDTGKNWRNVSDGLKYFLQVTAMAVYDTMMIVATVSPGSQNYWQAWRPISEMVDTSPASVVQTQPADSLSIYPNPARDEVTILGKGLGGVGMEVEIFDLLGRNHTVPTTSLENGISIDVSAIPAGIYYLRLASGGVIQTRPLSIVR